MIKNWKSRGKSFDRHFEKLLINFFLSSWATFGYFFKFFFEKGILKWEFFKKIILKLLRNEQFDFSAYSLGVELYSSGKAIGKPWKIILSSFWSTFLKKKIFFSVKRWWKNFFGKTKIPPKLVQRWLFPISSNFWKNFYFSIFLCFLVTAKVTKTDFFFLIFTLKIFFFHFFFFSRFTSSPRLPSIFSNFTIVKSNAPCAHFGFFCPFVLPVAVTF